MPGHIRRNLLIFLALLTATAAVGALHWLLPAGELKDAAGIVQAVITAMAIIGILNPCWHRLKWRKFILPGREIAMPQRAYRLARRCLQFRPIPPEPGGRDKPGERGL